MIFVLGGIALGFLLCAWADIIAGGLEKPGLPGRIEILLLSSIAAGVVALVFKGRDR